MNASCRFVFSIASRAALAAVLLSGTALSAPPDSGREEAVRSVQKALPLKAGQKLTVEHTNGAVRVHAGSGSQVSVDARIRVSASDRAEAEKFSNGITIEIEPSAAGVSVKTRYPQHDRGMGIFRNISYSVDYEITMPDSAELSVRNRFGDVEVEKLKASADVVNTNGKVVFRSGKGRQRLENAFGSVELISNAGDATIVNSNGPVTASDIEGDLDIRSRFGKVLVTRVGKRCEITNGNGDLSVTDVKGDAILTNSFGRLEVRGVGGMLEARATNGALTAEGITGRASLTASFGSISFADFKSDVSVSGTNCKVSRAQGRRHTPRSGTPSAAWI